MKVKDSYYTHAFAYGSLFIGSDPNQYYSFVGELVQVTHFLPNNPNESVMYNNATLVIRNGVTGAHSVAGSFISFRQNGKEYHLQIVNGQKSNCTSADSGPVPQYSKIFSNLIQIYPFPGVNPKPGEYSVCQGSIPEGLGGILNIVWDQSQKNVFQTSEFLSGSQSTHTVMNELRPLTDADNHFLINPCPKGAENLDTDQLIELIHGALRHH